jgi:beta-mannosidase
LEHDLRLARDAGANMLRIGGTMTYESDAFYRLCDELGILVWQDFMFANMDYPIDDPAFHENISQEAGQQLQRLASHPCVAIYCGNSEIEQQAAMLGMPRESWSNRWFADELPRLCAALHPGTCYVPSTPTGGVLPFHTNVGVTHFYGVGAYLRSPAELRSADVKFTSECLAFANVPEAATCYEIMHGAAPVMHHPRWKARVPRDTGAGWDFDDVRDHYLGQLYGVDPVRLRLFDMPRYLQLSRVVSGEMMIQAFAEWRGARSHNSGALVWFYKDLWPAAGWGVIDSHGRPKAAYYALKRSWRSLQAAITDEGLNGLDVHLINETGSAVCGALEITLLREPNLVVAHGHAPLNVEARSREVRSVDALLGRFCDVNYVYRFGPPQHDVAIATWRDERGAPLGEAFHFVNRRQHAVPAQAVEVYCQPAGDGEYDVTVEADSFLHSVCLAAEGFLADDNYFHLVPRRSKRIRFRPLVPASAFHAELDALNLESIVAVPERARENGL